MNFPETDLMKGWGQVVFLLLSALCVGIIRMFAEFFGSWKDWIRKWSTVPRKSNFYCSPYPFITKQMMYLFLFHLCVLLVPLYYLMKEITHLQCPPKKIQPAQKQKLFQDPFFQQSIIDNFGIDATTLREIVDSTTIIFPKKQRLIFQLFVGDAAAFTMNRNIYVLRQKDYISPSLLVIHQIP